MDADPGFRNLLEKIEKLASFCEITTIGRIIGYVLLSKGRKSLSLAAQQRGARIGPTCAVLAALVGRLQPIDQERNSWVRRLLACTRSKQPSPRCTRARSCSACADLSRALGGDCVVGVASDFARERLVINLLVAGRKFSALALKGMLARVI
jgi:hypothetical protein